MVARGSDEVLYEERALIWLSNQTGVTFAMEQKRTVTDKLEKKKMMTNGGKMQQQQQTTTTTTTTTTTKRKKETSTILGYPMRHPSINNTYTCPRKTKAYV